MDLSRYPPKIHELLVQERQPSLDAGHPQTAMYPRLAGLTAHTLFAPGKVRDEDAARACLAGLWLYFDFLDESHAISQELHTPEGSYWHALMHRREQDFGNSKYWFHRVGRHAVFPILARSAAALVQAETALPPAARFLTTSSTWNPSAFVDLCVACLQGRAAVVDLAERIQQLEWELLFDYCFKQAVDR